MNPVFEFPKYGGIWRKVGELLPGEKWKMSTQRFSDDTCMEYKKMIITTPLDLTLKMTGRPDLADRLNYSSTHIIGIGIRGVHALGNKCWMYFPEDNTPFYRCTVFSNYSVNNCPPPTTLLPTLRVGENLVTDASPKPGPYWSLMFEISASEKHKTVDEINIVDDTIAAAVGVGLISQFSEIVSVYHRRLQRGYPTPHLNRNSALADAEHFLRSNDIWSRGRFGAWKYEVSNPDHSLMQGVEAVDNIFFETDETTLNKRHE